jgi:type III restriction enzyme
MKKGNIILQKLVENRREISPIPSEWRYRNIKSFGLEWNLFSYQIKAINNTIYLLYLFFNGWKADAGKETNKKIIEENRQKLLGLYKRNGLYVELEEELAISKGKEENFEFLKNFYKYNGRIPFEYIINRAAFWMATGSGKTLVIIKLIVVLTDLIKKKLIPKEDILFLAPKDDILNQVREHTDKFNKGSEVKVNLRSVKEYERIKNQQGTFSSDEVTVFYYRADNITSKDMVAKKKDGQRINYEEIYNNGDWYLLLDEAHKGEKETSKRQQYYTVLAKNGFMFNFSATFTDTLDNVTTIFDYKLDTFLKDGYGKMLYLADINFQGFARGGDEKEQEDIITQTLIMLAIAKQRYHKLQKVDQKLYHSPLLITLANSVNTDEADLKIFYKLLARISRGVNFDFSEVKDKLIEKLEGNSKYLFSLGELDARLVPEIRNLSEKDFRRVVFNWEDKGNIEYIKLRDNSKELVFKLAAADKYFMLIHASDIVKWEDNALEGYESGAGIEESFFNNLENRPDINILLGSRIFAEGWDTNRPNIINFINIGVSDEAIKYVMQSIGRGLRIEPLPNQRQRFKYIDRGISYIDREKILKYNKVLESLFIFATNKDVVKGILEDLEKQSGPDWIKVNGIKKNDAVEEINLPIFIPFFGKKTFNEKPFWIGKNEHKMLNAYINKAGPKVLLLKNGMKIRTYNKSIVSNNFNIETNKRHKKSPENILIIADNYFNEKINKLSEIKILDGEISHFKEVTTNIGKEEAKKLEKDLFKVLKPYQTEEKIDKEYKDKKISLEEYKQKIKEIATKNNFDVLGKEVNYKILQEHYYSPILFKKDTDKFQHIIKKESEIVFLDNLVEYLKQDENKLKNYDWWYFSKIDESVDKIGIPYFNSEIGRYQNFYPDFIFWLKKNGKCYLKFIDPHGVQFISNTTDKIDGFNDFCSDLSKLNSKNISKVELYFYNDKEVPHGVDDFYKKYFTSDFQYIFSI